MSSDASEGREQIEIKLVAATRWVATKGHYSIALIGCAVCDIGVGESARVIASVTRKRSRRPPFCLSRRSQAAAGVGARTRASMLHSGSQHPRRCCRAHCRSVRATRRHRHPTQGSKPGQTHSSRLPTGREAAPEMTTSGWPLPDAALPAGSHRGPRRPSCHVQSYHLSGSLNRASTPPQPRSPRLPYCLPRPSSAAQEHCGGGGPCTGRAALHPAGARGCSHCRHFYSRGKAVSLWLAVAAGRCCRWWH